MKPITVTKYLMPVLVVAALMGTVAIAKLSGAWQTSGRGQVMLDASGLPAPEGIKGWMTLVDVSEIYGLPMGVLHAMLGATSDLPTTTALKDLEKLLPGMAVSSVREYVGAYLDGTTVPGEDPSTTGTPQDAALESNSTAKPLPGVDEENGAAGYGLGQGRDLSLPADGGPLPASGIKGWMTLQDVVTLCQVPMVQLADGLSLPDDVDVQFALRDLAGRYGIEVGAVRDIVETYQSAR
jgi:hypothetical protein